MAAGSRSFEYKARKNRSLTIWFLDEILSRSIRAWTPTLKFLECTCRLKWQFQIPMLISSQTISEVRKYTLKKNNLVSYAYQLEEHRCLHLNNVVSFITRNKRKCSIDSLKVLRKGHESVFHKIWCRIIVYMYVRKKYITSRGRYSTICHNFYRTIL